MLTQTLAINRLPWPTDWTDIFGRHAPLLIEIGFGNSTFLTDLARQYPNANILGLEISYPSLKKGERKTRNAKITNVYLIEGQAQVALWLLFAPHSIDSLYINFPDPWPKPAHHRRRLINDNFLRLVATRIQSNGTIDIATDHNDYADWITSCFERSPYFFSRLEKPFATRDVGRIRTKYEKKALAEGQSCYYFKWQRNDEIATNDFIIPQELAMPHVLIHIPLRQEEIYERFQPARFSSASISVRLIDIYRSKKDNALLFDTYITEQPLEQRLLLRITMRENEDRLINVHDVGFPRPTPGVHYALHCLTSWLSDLHEGATVINQNLLQVG